MHLRLDMYLNGGNEQLVGEADATRDGFESLMQHNWLIFPRITDDIETTGTSLLTADEIADEDMQDILWDIFGREIKATDTITFCMCLWDGDEHLESAIGIGSLEE